MTRTILSPALLALCVALTASPLIGCDKDKKGGDSAKTEGGDKAKGGDKAEAKELTVYVGRSKAMVQGLFDAFTKETGIKVNARYAKTTALANTLLEEGERSPADLFFAQDAGALGAVGAKGMFAKLDDALLQKVDKRFQGADGTWVGTSGRARVVTYNTAKLKPEDLPKSIEGFTDPKWKGRIGWPPKNASFQAFVTAFRKLKGEEAAEKWLAGIKANEPKVYPKNTPAVKGVAAGEVDVAFVNHYYLHRLKKEAGDKPFAAANYHPPGDIGSLMNVAGIGILKTSKAPKNAAKLIDFLLSKQAQELFATKNFEYPLTAGIKTSDGVTPVDKLDLPKLELGKMSDLQETLKLLKKTKVL